MKTLLRLFHSNCKVIISTFCLTALTLLNPAAYSQSIDSLIIIPEFPTTDDTLNVHVFGTLGMMLDRLIRVETQISEDSIRIDLFFNSCASWAMPGPYDTAFSIGKLEARMYHLACFTWFDTLVLDTINCWQMSPEIIFCDSLTLTFMVTSIEPFNNILNIYPNPASDIIAIEFSQTLEPQYITITDITGRLVYQSAFSNRIDVSHLPKGMYVLSVQVKEGQFVKKIII